MTQDRKTILLIAGFFLIVFLSGCIELLFVPPSEIEKFNEENCNRLMDPSIIGAQEGTICASTIEEKFSDMAEKLPPSLQAERQEGIEKERIYSFNCNPQYLRDGPHLETVQDCADEEKACQQNGTTASCVEKPESADLSWVAKEYNRQVCERLLEKTGANNGTVCASTIESEFRSLIQPVFLPELLAGLQEERFYSFQCNPNDLEAGFHLNTVSDCGTRNTCTQINNNAKCKSSIEAEAQPETCVTPEGKSGITGPKAVPMVSFSTNWNDFSNYAVLDEGPIPSLAKALAMAATAPPTGNPRIGPDNVFLDGEQFFMVLFWKLKAKYDSQDMEPFEFFVLLKQDKFTTKLQEAFAEQSTGFANTPSWFKDGGTPFYQYASAAAFEINSPNDSVQPGLYKASVSFETSRQPAEFFYTVGKTANQMAITQLGIEKISITLERIEAAFVPSPLYYISLDAATNPADPADRDFGKKFSPSNNENPEQVIYFTNALSSTQFLQGATETKILVSRNFETLNSSEAKVIATFNSDGSTIFFFPQQAVALAAMPNESQQASFAYYFIKDAEAWQSTGATSFLSWNFTASTRSCNSFTPYRNKKDAVANNCIENSSIKGFEIARPTPNPTDYPIGTSMVLVPPGEQFAIKTCETGSLGAKIATPKGTSNGSALDLVSEEGYTVQTVEQLLNGVEQGKVCIVNSENESSFNWNQGTFKALQHAAAEKLQSGLQWCENCPIGESLLQELIEYVKQNNPDLASRIASEQSCSVQS